MFLLKLSDVSMLLFFKDEIHKMYYLNKLAIKNTRICKASKKLCYRTGNMNVILNFNAF